MYNDNIIQFLGKLPFREGGFHGSLKQIRLPDGSADSNRSVRIDERIFSLMKARDRRCT